MFKPLFRDSFRFFFGDVSGISLKIPLEILADITPESIIWHFSLSFSRNSSMSTFHQFSCPSRCSFKNSVKKFNFSELMQCFSEEFLRFFCFSVCNYGRNFCRHFQRHSLRNSSTDCFMSPSRNLSSTFSVFLMLFLKKFLKKNLEEELK